MNKKNILGLAFILVIIIISLYFGVNKQDQETIKIGDLSALTGPFAIAGQMLTNSAKIAAEEINAKGGINGRMIEILTEDTENDSKKAVSAYQNLKLKGVHYYIGEASPIVSPVRPLAISDGNLLISSSAITPSFTDGELLSCRFSLTSQNIAPALIDLIKIRNYKTVSLLLPDSEYGKTLYDELLKNNQNSDIILQKPEFYLANNTPDYRTNITKIVSQQKDSDVLILVNNSATIEPMIKQLKEMGWKKQLISDNATINNPALKDLSLVNTVEYVDYEYSRLPETTDTPETKSFKDKYRTLTNSEAAYIPAGHYDAIRLLAYAISQVGDNPEKVAKFISNLKDYKGITGTLSFNSDCEAIREKFYRKVIDGKFIEIKF